MPKVAEFSDEISSLNPEEVDYWKDVITSQANLDDEHILKVSAEKN